MEKDYKTAILGGLRVQFPLKNVVLFTDKVITSFSSNWFTLLLICTSASLVLCCDWFNCGSREVKRESVDLATEDYHFVSEFLN